jgi:very-short-patch-repair endonuclease
MPLSLGDAPRRCSGVQSWRLPLPTRARSRRGACGSPSPAFERPGAAGDKLAQARAMRAAPTAAEAVLWPALAHVIAGYIVDFYCAELRLALEVDGAVHDAQRFDDRAREDHLASLGVCVMRPRNDDVLEHLDAVVLSGASAGGWRHHTGFLHALPRPATAPRGRVLRTHAVKSGVGAKSRRPSGADTRRRSTPRPRSVGCLDFIYAAAEPTPPARAALGMRRKHRAPQV